MSWRRRWIQDLQQPESPTRRQELRFLIASAAAIIVTAQWSEPGGPWELGLLIVAGAAFVIRGLVPRLPSEIFVAVVAAAVGGAVGIDGAVEVGFFLVVIAVLYGAWHAGSLTRATVMLAAAAGLPWMIATVLDADIGWAPWTSACVFTFVLGRNLRRQQLLIDQLEASQQALAVHAVQEERRRMARELHDLAGHHLAAMLLHVTGARHVLRRDLADAELALRDAEAVGRSGLEQIRSTVAVLRTDETGTDAALAGSADVVHLVDAYRRAGLDITTRWNAPALDVDGPVGTAVHRIAREALANIARHAPHHSVEVTIELLDSDAIRLEITDHGGGPALAARPGGFGLVGMSERARALGGEVSAGPTGDGWCVEARLPLLATASGSGS